MLGRTNNKPAGEVLEQGKIIAFDRAGHTHTETNMPSSSSLFAPPKLFLATSDAADGEAAAVLEHAEVVMSPTSILQDGSSTCHHVHSGRLVPLSIGGSSGDNYRSKGKSRRRRPWEARPVGLGLADALNGEPPGEAMALLNGKTSQYRSVRNIHAPSCGAGQYSTRPCLSPAEMEASEDYTRVIVRGPNAGTVDIFDDHVVGVNSGGLSPPAGGSEGAFLRWCHGCSKDLDQGKDIFMYRSVTASLSLLPLLPEISRVSITTKNRAFSTP
jgi:hypothetical protein